MATRKKRRAFYDTLTSLLAEGVRAGEIKLSDGESEGEGEGMPRDEAVALAVIKKALAGDIQAVKFIADATAMSAPKSNDKPFRLTLVVKRPEDGGAKGESS